MRLFHLALRTPPPVKQCRRPAQGAASLQPTMRRRHPLAALYPRIPIPKYIIQVHPCAFLSSLPPLLAAPFKPALVFCTLRPLASARRANVRHTYLPLSHYKPAHLHLHHHHHNHNHPKPPSLLSHTTSSRPHPAQGPPAARPFAPLCSACAVPCCIPHRTAPHYTTLRYACPELRSRTRN
ncbi:hypothetical protein HDV63DRAFT_153521 [Trichoderma sp. SZMC 28014]